MAKAFAKTFYRSAKWLRCREAYISARRLIDGGLCECCREKPGEELHHKTFLTPDNINDPNITLNHDNLAWLCKDCHFKAHEEAILSGLKKTKRQSRILNDNGYYFDENGDLLPQKIYVVYGAPASGKTRYVREHKADGDMVVDFDYLQQAISMNGKKDRSVNLISTVLDIREYIYSLVEARKIDCKNIWIVACLPRKEERLALISRLHAEPIYIHATKEECMRHADEDTERKDKHEQHAIISKWFEDYEK